MVVCACNDPCATLCVQFPMISEFGDDRNSYCSFEPKDTALLQSENGSLQQRLNILTLEVRGHTPKYTHPPLSGLLFHLI